MINVACEEGDNWENQIKGQSLSDYKIAWVDSWPDYETSRDYNEISCFCLQYMSR